MRRRSAVGLLDGMPARLRRFDPDEWGATGGDAYAVYVARVRHMEAQEAWAVENGVGLADLDRALHPEWYGFGLGAGAAPPRRAGRHR